MRNAGKELAAWQGPAIYCWNDQTFSPADFTSISKVALYLQLQTCLDLSPGN